MAHETRWQRIMDCVALKQPDRMPVALYCFFWLAKYGGVSYKQLMYDQKLTAEIGERAVLEFEPDVTCPFLTNVAWGAAADAVELKAFDWAGNGIGENQSFQYRDKEYVTVAEYDEFLDDPTDFFQRKFLPKVAGAFEGLANMPSLVALSGLRVLPGIAGFARPEVKASLLKIIAAAEEVMRLQTNSNNFNKRIATLGYPMIYGVTAGNAYDSVADYWRGASGMMTDMYRHKDKMLEILYRVFDYMEAQAIAGAQASGNPIVFLPIHWAPDAFMSQKQFETFWWPTFRRLLLSLIAKNLIPMVLWEHDCSKRMETIADVPAGKCIYFFERADNVIKAWEVMGKNIALRGGLSAGMMVAGTPDDVDREVRGLVEKVWDKGGNLILDCGIGIPDEGKVENVRAMFVAARKYAG